MRLVLARPTSPGVRQNRLAPEPSDVIEAQEGVEVNVVKDAALAAEVGKDPIALVDSELEVMQQLVQQAVIS